MDAIVYATEKAACIEKGFVLVDFPHTLHEAQLLSERGINPHPVFIMTLPLQQVVNRCKPGPGFANDESVLLRRISVKKENY